MRWSDLENEPCPVARGLSVVGDRWTLLVLRDCFRGLRRFDDIHASLKITRHVLADRLKRLESTGVLERQQYSTAPPRFEYRLTEKGRALYPVMVSLIQWAETYQPHDGTPPYRFHDRETNALLDPVLVDRGSQVPIDSRHVRAARAQGADKPL
ncbi:helix-turn-helix domain-containing protein [Pseudooceanicola sp.]|uniref:winged helix-turn-helix transcriptional regulator n=1 Tax=Pseudooceanicola sp. TaxID=1914328 RepID=UPI0026292056|nr:helix-turn-helix domain-containing protein [Pseudooceanicola sp.]MDF1855145.1 helix-turn-helix domain-containing protein [Pseudooceanicola sp.]